MAKENQKSANDLAVERTDLAVERTRMAYERTMMAWVRTSLSMISFGITLVKFVEYLQKSQPMGGRFQGDNAFVVGIALIVVGTLLLIPASYQHWAAVKSLSAKDGKSPWSLALVVGLAIGGIGLLAFISAFWRS